MENKAAKLTIRRAVRARFPGMSDAFVFLVFFESSTAGSITQIFHITGGCVITRNSKAKSFCVGMKCEGSEGRSGCHLSNHAPGR